MLLQEEITGMIFLEMRQIGDITITLQAGLFVGKYIRSEMIIEKTKESYCDAMKESSILWRDGKNSHAPFIKYYPRKSLLFVKNNDFLVLEV